MKRYVDVSVVVGANTRLIFDCLDSFLKYAPADYTFRIVVTCNQANTDVPERLRTRFGAERLEIIENPQPRGFAENHNRILEKSTADYMFILNDDLIFLPNAVEKMLHFMERPENQRIAALSPKLLNPDRTLQPSTYSFPSLLRAFLSISGLRAFIPFSPLMNRVASWLGLGRGRSRFWDHSQTVDVDTFRGACVLVRMQAVREVGLMHTFSLVGGEETEWHYRFWKRGWRVVFYPEAEVIHYGGQTVKRNPVYRNEYLKGYLYFFSQHRSRLAFYTLCVLSLSALCARWIWNVIVRRLDMARVDLNGIRLILKWLRQSIK
ncbi:MAG: glycosyltransferase [candidate division WOR-3 bacterium]